MNLNNLKTGKTYNLRTTHSDNANYFVVETDDGMRFNIKKLKFQLNETTPDTLPCLVKSTRDGQPILTLDLTPYIEQFYKQGQEYEFKVRADYSRNNFYEVEDENGLYFRLPANGAKLEVGQTVACRVVRVAGSSVQLKLVSRSNEVRGLKFWTIDDVKEKVCHNGESLSWMVFALKPEVATYKEQYTAGDARWIINVLEGLIKKIPSWFTEDTDYGRVEHRLDAISRATLALLEGSDFLTGCNDSERRDYRHQLSRMTQSVNHFKRASCLLRDGDHNKFIDQMLGNLKLSGYLYNPDSQFRTFNTMLRIHPDLIHAWMGKIFDALTAWPIDNWKMEPFRSAFMRQTELYIRQNQALADEMVNFKDKENIDIVTKMIMALAIQMLIVDDEADRDVNTARNRAMFYRYCSYINNVARPVLLDKAFASVMGVEMRPNFTWDDLRQPVMLITKSGVDSSASLPQNTLKTYTSGNNHLEVSAQGISLRHGSQEKPIEVLSRNLNLWQGLQVYVDDSCDISKNVVAGAKYNNLNNHKKLWEDIERTFFSVKAVPTQSKKNYKPGVGEVVKIVVTGVERTLEGKILCACTVVDDGYEGTGWLNARDIVRYVTEPTPYDFYDEETGGRMIFEARVQGVNAEGQLSFSMLDQVDDCIVDNVSIGDEGVCVVTSKQEKSLMCLNENGYSVVVQDDNDEYGVKDFVKVRVIEAPAANRIKGVITGIVPDEERFNPGAPIHNILQAVCVDIEAVETVEEENIIQADETITYEQVDEIIAIVRRLAFSSQNYTEAYNYLGFARVLARMIADDQMAAMCSEHMDLLVLLHNFARERSVDAHEVEKHALTASRNPMLNMLYTRLLIVSRIGRPEDMQSLWDMQSTVATEDEANLLRKVISLNLMHQSGEVPDKFDSSIIDQICTLLNVNFYQNDTKFYGAETQFVEFKTSIVYPAGNHMQADVEKQGHEIAQIVCGFLNADGGTLYIGVNDHGYECGVGDDMQYLKVNMDKYILKVENIMNSLLGATANSHITISQDSESKRGVVVVDVKPCMHVIAMKDNGAVYVRHTTSTRRIAGDDLATFEKDREMRYKQLVAMYK